MKVIIKSKMKLEMTRVAVIDIACPNPCMSSAFVMLLSPLHAACCTSIFCMLHLLSSYNPTGNLTSHLA